MRYALTVVTATILGLALSACESTGQYDGVSRFADTGSPVGSYYGPGSPPRDFGDSGSHS